MKPLFVLPLILLLAAPAAAQDELDALRAQYERGIETGDADLIAATFAEDGVFTPIAGGTYEGREAVRAYYREDPVVQGGQAQFSAAPTRSERLTDDLLHEVGTFTLVVPTDGGERRLEGEYTAVATREDGDWKIHHLTSFAPRGPAAVGAPLSAEEMEASLRHLERVYSEGTPEEIADLYTEDAVFQSIFGPTIEGREAVRDFYANLPPDALPEGSRLHITPTHFERVGGLAYGTGSWAWVAPSGEAVMAGEYVNLMKEVDGEWKEHRLTTFAPRGMPEE